VTVERQAGKGVEVPLPLLIESVTFWQVMSSADHHQLLNYGAAAEQHRPRCLLDQLWEKGEQWLVGRPFSLMSISYTEDLAPQIP
jgi:hypothetical protein